MINRRDFELNNLYFRLRFIQIKTKEVNYDIRKNAKGIKYTS
jgi:hypothetical protein